MEIEEVSRDYIVSYALRHTRYSDKYLMGNIKFEKNIKANTISKIQVGKVMNDKTTQRVAKDFLAKLKLSKIYNDINYIFTSLPVNHRRSGVKYITPYNLEDETELIDLYMQYQTLIEGNKIIKVNKNLSLGRGIYLDDGVKPPRFRFDYNEVDVLTIAIALGLRAILKSNAKNILVSLLDNKTKQDSIFAHGVFTSNKPPKDFQNMI